jgi:CheY-like chemotaxis protein
MALESSPNIRRESLACFSGFTQAINTQEPASGWRFAGESWIGIMAGSGSNQSPEKVQPSGSASQPEDSPELGPLRVLIAEDSKTDVFLIREALKTARLNLDIHVSEDGEDATAFIDGIDEDPTVPPVSLVLLDLNLPKKRGREVLEHVRASGRSREALVIVVSTSNSPQDRLELLQLGANAYFAKPSDYASFMKLGDVTRQVLATKFPPLQN